VTILTLRNLEVQITMT